MARKVWKKPARTKQPLKTWYEIITTLRSRRITDHQKSADLARRQVMLNMESVSISREQVAAEKEKVEIARLERTFPLDPQLAPRKAKLDHRFKALGYRGQLLGNGRSALKMDTVEYQRTKVFPALEALSDLASSSSQLLAGALTADTPRSKPQSQPGSSVSAGPARQQHNYPCSQPAATSMNQPMNNVASSCFGPSGGAGYSSFPAWATTFAGPQPHQARPQQDGAQARPSFGVSGWGTRAPAVQTVPFGPLQPLAEQAPTSVSQVGTSSRQQSSSSRGSTPHARESLRRINPPAGVDSLTRQHVSDAHRERREIYRSQRWWDDGSVPFCLVIGY